jgi:hypothetical protein
MDPISWRFIERILAVAIGGISIYLGYRLFAKVPEQRDSEGKVTLPGGVTVILSRVGPGVFFALFGAAVVAYALHESVTFTREQSAQTTDQNNGAGTVRVEREVFGGFGPATAPAGGRPLAMKRLEARLNVEFLNTLPQLLRPDLTEEQKRTVDARVTALKLGIMQPLWGPDWGQFQAFRDWAEGGAPAPVPKGLEAAADYYRAGHAGVK